MVLLLVAPVDGAVPAAADLAAATVQLERLAGDAAKVLDADGDFGGDGFLAVTGRRVEVLYAESGPVAGGGIDDEPVLVVTDGERGAVHVGVGELREQLGGGDG